MYLATSPQPNLAFSVSLVLCFASNLNKVHVKAVKIILCYLLATTNIGLVFGGSSDQELIGYTDVNYASCITRRRFTLRYFFLYNQATLKWRSKKQEYVALSTIKAEYIF